MNIILNEDDKKIFKMLSDKGISESLIFAMLVDRGTSPESVDHFSKL
ncbi:hypothetical protein [Methanosarcina mazei]|nr:hypothetical protein [Methanosarcina mazei]